VFGVGYSVFGTGLFRTPNTEHRTPITWEATDAMLRLGIVDFDTSHVVEFTKRLHRQGVSEEQCVDGARMVAGCPGESAIMPERIGPYSGQLRDLGVEMVERPEELLGRVDGVLVESQQGSAHLGRARPFLEAGLPVFIDKPFTCSVVDAREIERLSRENDAPVFSSSSLRYVPELLELLAHPEPLGAIHGAATWTPASLHPGNPGLFHYGIHGVEALYAVLGPGCREVWCAFEPGGEVVMGRWEDGRIGTVRGIRTGAAPFGVTFFAEKGVRTLALDTKVIYRELLRQIVHFFETGRSPVPLTVSVEIVAFIEAALHSAENSGERTPLAR
jgi:virulence factor